MKRVTDISKESQAAYEILAYLADHPFAQDSLNGIMDWWLTEKRFTRQVVSNALVALVNDGLVLERKMQNLPTRYSINRDRMPEIKKFLEEDSAGYASTAETCGRRS
ncbi:MAG TPA: hypothetical protein VMT71_16980 [Syntrophorhabdales bacterium]|nr:hypothetical protein [Syntrophorhabdales bacterium]